MVRSFGRTVPLEYRIVEMDRPRRVVLSAENSLVRSTDVIEISSGPGSGSTVTYDATLRLRGVAVLFSPFLGVSFRRLGDRAIVGLRTTLGA
jgi:hypothetical protein